MSQSGKSLRRTKLVCHNMKTVFWFFFLDKKTGVLFKYIKVYTKIDTKTFKGHSLLIPRFSISYTKGAYTKDGQVP